MLLETTNSLTSIAGVEVYFIAVPEFGIWLWESFKMDITLLDLLGPESLLDALVEAIGSRSNE